MAKSKKGPQLDASLAEARAELMERILKKLNQGATFREVSEVYGVTHGMIRKYLATMHVHMTVEESNYMREIAEHFGMLPNEAVAYFARSCMQQAYAKDKKGAAPSKHSKAHRESVLDLVYNRIMGQRGDFELHTPDEINYNQSES